MPPPPRRVGAYAKLVATYASDDAVIAAGEAAELLFVRALAFCATSDSDGYITDAQITRFVGAGMRDAIKRADKLVTVGLWERSDGGYVVRSWTKLHMTSKEKGRKLKADRERKRTAHDSETPSARNPDGIQTEGVSDSLSLIHDTTETQQRHDTTTTAEGSFGGERPETLRAVDATKPPTCQTHPDGNFDGPCGGCKRVREWGDKGEARAKADAVKAAKECDDCGGTGWLEDPKTKTPTRKCDHRSTRRTA
jgi:hypothetical protein